MHTSTRIHSPATDSAAHRRSDPRPRGDRRRSRKAHHSRRRARPAFARRGLRALSSVTAMGAAAALLVGTSIPDLSLPRSRAYADVAAASSTVTRDAPTQSMTTADRDGALPQVATRDEWSATSPEELLRAKYGNRDFSYNAAGQGAVRWPFPFAVPITSGFGDRAAPCRGCSTYHRGIDMDGGAGTPISAVADGVVAASDEGSTYGEHIFIDSVVNGQPVRTLYAHMEWGSTPLRPGDAVKAGDLVGRVGNSGLSTGPHLHLEVRSDGVPVDPFAWLVVNAS